MLFPGYFPPSSGSAVAEQQLQPGGSGRCPHPTRGALQLAGVPTAQSLQRRAGPCGRHGSASAKPRQRPLRAHPHAHRGSRMPTNAPHARGAGSSPPPRRPPVLTALPRTAPSRGRAPPPLTHIRGPAPPRPAAGGSARAAFPGSGAAAAADGGSDGGLSRHGAVRGRAVAAAAEEALGPRRRLRAVPRVFPQQHLQAGRGGRRTGGGGGRESRSVWLHRCLSLQEERTVRDRNLLQVQEHEQPILWKEQFSSGNGSHLSNQCRNSVQGKLLITDELGTLRALPACCCTLCCLSECWWGCPVTRLLVRAPRGSASPADVSVVRPY